jgi:hypothetical protein
VLRADITVWLSGLGLRKYVDKFVHEEIDVDTLPYLTEEHLEKLVRATRSKTFNK